MANITAADVKKFREETGAGMMDCKKALKAADGDLGEAREILRQKNLIKADKKADRETKEGYLASYVHNNNKIATSIEKSPADKAGLFEIIIPGHQEFFLPLRAYTDIIFFPCI